MESALNWLSNSSEEERIEFFKRAVWTTKCFREAKRVENFANYRRKKLKPAKRLLEVKGVVNAAASARPDPPAASFSLVDKKLKNTPQQANGGVNMKQRMSWLWTQSSFHVSSEKN